MAHIEEIIATVERRRTQVSIESLRNPSEWYDGQLRAYSDVLTELNLLRKEAETNEDLELEVLEWVGKFNPAIREAIQSTAYHFAGRQRRTEACKGRR